MHCFFLILKEIDRNLLIKFCYPHLCSNAVAVLQYTFTYKQYTKEHNETEYNTFIKIKIHKYIIRIHKHNNKYIQLYTQNTTHNPQ